MADRDNHLIRQITLNKVVTTGASGGTIQAGTVSTVAGGGAGGRGGFLDGVGADAAFNQPQDIVLVEDGSNSYMLVSDRLNNNIRHIAMSTYEVTVFAGSPSRAAGLSNGVGVNANFNQPMNMALDPTGTFVLIADYGNNRIRQLVLATKQVNTVAGSPILTGYSYTVGRWVNGRGTNAGFRNPSGVAFDPTGAFVFVADYNNRAIRKMTLEAVTGSSTGQVIGTVEDFAGAKWSALTVSDPDGVGSAASFSNVVDVVVDPSGTFVYVIDPNVRRVRSVEIATAQVTSLVGSVASGSGVAGSQDGVGTSVTFQSLGNIEVDPFGTYMLVTDTSGNRVRMLAPAPSLCEAGYYCPARSSSARHTACNAGYFCPAGSSTATASFCKPGYYCPGGGIPRVAFQAGTFGSLAGQVDDSSNATCFAGYFCPAGSSAGTGAGLCSAGKFCPPGSGAETPCSAGFYCPTTLAQIACPDNAFCPAGSSAFSVTCPGGLVCTGSGMTPCAAGSYCPGGNSPAQTCPIGSSCPLPAMPSPEKCRAGLFCNATGLTVAAVCPVGTFCAAGSSAPSACPSGRICNVPQLGAADACPAGAACGTSAGVSATCQPGWYSFGNASACSKCVRGLYSAAAGTCLGRLKCFSLF